MNRELLEKFDLGRLNGLIDRYEKPAIAFQLSRQPGAPSTRSKLGGLPRLPASYSWPRSNMGRCWHAVLLDSVRRPRQQVILYGSRAKGNYKNGSDIDLTLRGGADLTLKVLYKIMGELDDLPLPYTIDLSIFDDISDLDVIEHIQRVGITFYQKGETVPEPG
jgi:predicted nucleotidyltransferase